MASVLKPEDHSILHVQESALNASGSFVSLGSSYSMGHAPISSIDISMLSDTSVLVLGKVGVGKARIINEVFGRTVFPCKAKTPVVKGVSQREGSVTTASGATHRVALFDTVGIKRRGGRVRISKTMLAIRKYVSELYPRGLNLILLVFRHEDFTKTERKRFMYIIQRLNDEKASLITGLVITGCTDKNDSARQKIISEFDSNRKMQRIGTFLLQGMHTVGFTDTEGAPDAMKEMFHALNYRDALLLREVVERCHRRQLNYTLLFHRGRYRGCHCPWHYCLCYDRIYTCWRWGYSWEDCLRVRVESRDDV